MKVLTEQLKVLITRYEDMQKQSKHNDLSDLSKVERQSLITRSLASIHRISGTNSNEIKRIMEEDPQLHRHTSSIIGIVSALHDDLEAGYMKSLVDLVHADVFADFLDMAYHLQESGFKDAAAVISGSTLESHIKELCKFHGIPLENDKGKPIKADTLNSCLVKKDVYTKLDQKNITAWFDLRNKAAHGNYNEYTLEQVGLLISGIRDFVGRVHT